MYFVYYNDGCGSEGKGLMEFNDPDALCLFVAERMREDLDRKLSDYIVISGDRLSIFPVKVVESVGLGK